MKTHTLIFLKFAIIINLLICNVLALQAPYMTKATSTNDSTIEITWRNNDINTNGYLLYRSLDSLLNYSFISQINKYGYTYEDFVLSSNTKYYYKCVAYSEQDTSEFSNIISATTLDFDKIFVKPSLDLYWFLDSMKLRFLLKDSSNCESMYIVSVQESFNEQNTIIFDTIKFINPKNYDSTIKFYELPEMNRFYEIKVNAIGPIDSIVQAEKIFTYNQDVFFSNHKVITSMSKICDYPISLKGWAVKSDNYVYLTESTAPDSSITKIDISNPSSPLFSGYLKTNYQFLFDSVNISLIGGPGLDKKSTNMDVPMDQTYSSYNNMLFAARRVNYGVDTIFSFVANDTAIIIKDSITINNEIKSDLFSHDCKGLIYLPISKKLLVNYCSIWQTGHTYYSDPFDIDNGTFAKNYSDIILIGSYDKGNPYYFNNYIRATYSSDPLNRMYVYDLSEFGIYSSKNIKYSSDVYNPYIDGAMKGCYFFGEYYLNDSTITPFYYDFLDTNLQLIYLVNDSLLSIYKYDTTSVSIKKNGGGIYYNGRWSVVNLSYVFNNSQVLFSYTLPKESFVNFEIYNLQGRKIGTLVSQWQQSMNHKLVWDVKGLGAGVYFCKLLVGNDIVTNRIILKR